MCPIKRTCNFYRQCPVIAEASDFPRTFPNMSKRSFSLTLIGAYFSLSEIISACEWLCSYYQGDMQDGRGGIDFKCLCTSENIRRKRLYSKEDGCFQSNSNLVRKVITLSNKVYVDVLAEFSKDGLLIPKEITWEDGRKYEITRVKDKRRAASTRAGGVGERYTCVVDGKEIFLFYEDNNMWFMERAGA